MSTPFTISQVVSFLQRHPLDAEVILISQETGAEWKPNNFTVDMDDRNGDSPARSRRPHMSFEENEDAYEPIFAGDLFRVLKALPKQDHLLTVDYEDSPNWHICGMSSEDGNLFLTLRYVFDSKPFKAEVEIEFSQPTDFTRILNEDFAKNIFSYVEDSFLKEIDSLKNAQTNAVDKILKITEGLLTNKVSK